MHDTNQGDTVQTSGQQNPPIPKNDALFIETQHQVLYTANVPPA